MGITKFAPIGGPRAPRSATQNQDWTRNYVATYLVVTDDPTDGPGTVRAAIPASLGLTYAEFDKTGAAKFRDNGSYITSITVAEDTIADDMRQWIATINYGPYQALQKPQDPTQEQPQIQWSSSKFQRPAVKDEITGDVIVNSAGDLFNPPIMRDDSRPMLVITRNEATHDPILAANCRDKTNASAWWVFPAKTVKCLDIVGRRVLNQDIGYYWEVEYSWEINIDDTWTYQALDQGFSTVVGGKKLRLTNDDGELISEPALLDGGGLVLPSGASAVYLPYDIYATIDFTIFGFDDFFTSLSGS